MAVGFSDFQFTFCSAQIVLAQIVCTNYRHKLSAQFKCDKRATKKPPEGGSAIGEWLGKEVRVLLCQKGKDGAVMKTLSVSPFTGRRWR